MADIKVSLVSDEGDEFIYDVEVDEGGSSTQHRVILKPEDFGIVTEGSIEPEDLIKRSFELMLENEPKEVILGEFNLKEIAGGFPDFEEEVLSR